MIERYLPNASSYAGDIDGIITLIAVLVGVWFVLVEVVFFGLIVAFRQKPGVKAEYISGEEPHQMRWIAIPHYLVLICDIFVIVATVRVWMHVKQELPVAEDTVRVIGQQWAWSFVHSGPDGELGTSDDVSSVDELHVKVGKNTHFKLEARDVMHDFSVPVFRLKQDAIPGRIITGWFKATKTGTFDIQCAEMCGIGHGLMPARIVVDTEASYDKWIAERSQALAAAR